MTGLYIIFGGMILFAAVVLIYDLLAEAQRRRERDHRKSA
jgi:hypothetical protein